MPEADNITFTVTCTMKRRWIPQFLGMLKCMQMLGAQGSSRDVTLFADGDGDFRPTFVWTEVTSPADPFMRANSGAYFDAG